MTATVEEDEAKTIATIDVVRMNNGADDPDANKDGYDGDGDISSSGERGRRGTRRRREEGMMTPTTTTNNTTIKQCTAEEGGG